MTATVIADPLAAVCSYLRAQIGGQLDQWAGQPAVFRPSLPEAVDASMPLTCVVVRAAGGYKMFGAGLLPVADPVLDVICYGEKPQGSYQVAVAAAHALKQLTQSVWNGVLLYWAKVSAGPVPLPDTETIWPATWLAAQVMYSEIATGGTADW